MAPGAEIDGKLLPGSTFSFTVGHTMLRDSLTFHASFDEAIRGDLGNGVLTPSTRSGPLADASQWVFRPGVDENVYRIARDKGVHAGCLEAVDVLPGKFGRFFFPAQGNVAFKPGGWAGALSCWINFNPDTMLKGPFCDPVQITQKGATNGGLWFDFNDDKPRSLRMGVFPAAPPGSAPIKETDADAPLIWVRKVGFQSGAWHHIAMTWANLDTGRADARATLYIDGQERGSIKDRDLSMNWDLDKTGIYVAVNYIGLLDELALFDRSLSAKEVQELHANPGLLARGG